MAGAVSTIAVLITVYGLALPYVVIKIGGFLGLHFLASLLVLFPLVLTTATYLIPHLFNSIVYKTRNLKVQYNAEWALVTGASSGKHLHQCCLNLAFIHGKRLCKLLLYLGSSVFETKCAAGIGKALATKLASQDLNVVLVALPDKLLDATYDELEKAYPKVTFRKVGLLVDI